MGMTWMAVLLASCVCALVTGKAGETAAALLETGNAVTLMLTLLGSMTLWSGLMEILSASGDVARIGRLLHRLASPLFPALTDEGCWSAMGMNLSANLLGLGNAATPSGIEAAKCLSRQGEIGMRALAMLLVLNNTGMQLLPTTVITLRQAAGSSDPAGIVLPTMMISALSTAVGVFLMMLFQRRRNHA